MKQHIVFESHIVVPPLLLDFLPYIIPDRREFVKRKIRKFIINRSTQSTPIRGALRFFVIVPIMAFAVDDSNRENVTCAFLVRYFSLCFAPPYSSDFAPFVRYNGDRQSPLCVNA